MTRPLASFPAVLSIGPHRTKSFVGAGSAPGLPRAESFGPLRELEGAKASRLRYEPSWVATLLNVVLAFVPIV